MRKEPVEARLHAKATLASPQVSGLGVLVMFHTVAKGAGVVVNMAKVDDVRLQQESFLGAGVLMLYIGVVLGIALNNRVG
jgi:hypothetical protein